jgi:hypothetical protein
MMLAIVNSFCLVVVMIVCAARATHMPRRGALIERVGLAILAGGALGVACLYWRHWQGVRYVHTILHIGMAIVALSVVRGQWARLVGTLRGWDGVDRRDARAPVPPWATPDGRV